MLCFDRIEALMKLNQITQTELLQKARQSPNNFARWKSGKSTPSWSSIIAIAKVLGVDPRYIVGQTDSPYGEEIMEKAVDQLETAGADVIPVQDPEGTHFIVNYEKRTRNYNEIEFKRLCHQLVTALNDSELQTSINFTNTLFGTKSKPVEENPYTKEEQELIENFRKLDPEGKIMLQSAMISELRRMK